MDPSTGEVVWGQDRVRRLLAAGSQPPRTLGDDTWKWLYLQPLAGVTPDAARR